MYTSALYLISLYKAFHHAVFLNCHHASLLAVFSFSNIRNGCTLYVGSRNNSQQFIDANKFFYQQIHDLIIPLLHVHVQVNWLNLNTRCFHLYFLNMNDTHKLWINKKDIYCTPKNPEYRLFFSGKDGSSPSLRSHWANKRAETENIWYKFDIDSSLCGGTDLIVIIVKV